MTSQKKKIQPAVRALVLSAVPPPVQSGSATPALVVCDEEVSAVLRKLATSQTYRRRSLYILIYPLYILPKICEPIQLREKCSYLLNKILSKLPRSNFRTLETVNR